MKAVEGRPNTCVFIWRKFHTRRHLRAGAQNFPYPVLLAETPDYDRVFKALSDRNRLHDAQNLQDQRLLFRAPDVHRLLHLLVAVQPAQSRPVMAAERASVRAVVKCAARVSRGGPAESLPSPAPERGLDTDTAPNNRRPYDTLLCYALI